MDRITNWYFSVLLPQNLVSAAVEARSAAEAAELGRGSQQVTGLGLVGSTFKVWKLPPATKIRFVSSSWRAIDCMQLAHFAQPSALG